MVLLWLLAALSPLQSQTQARTVKVRVHAQALVELCDQAREQGRPSNLDPARSELVAMQRELSRLDGLLTLLQESTSD